MSELEQLTEACVRLGAGHAQAEVMAAQLLKRAAQLVTERGCTREAALAHLLNVVVRGRAGEIPPGFSAPVSRPSDGKEL
jgi:hypothetical protein